MSLETTSNYQRPTTTDQLPTSSDQSPTGHASPAPPGQRATSSGRACTRGAARQRAISPCRASARQPVVSPPLHSTSAASRHPALRLARIRSVCSLVAPGRPSASLVSVQRGRDTTGCRRGKMRLRRPRCRGLLRLGLSESPVRNQLGGGLIRASVANQRLRGRERLRRIFALTLSRWPHRAGRPTGLVRRAPHRSDPITRGRHEGGRFWPAPTEACRPVASDGAGSGALCRWSARKAGSWLGAGSWALEVESWDRREVDSIVQRDGSSTLYSALPVKS
jgi:hypothetical protein